MKRRALVLVLLLIGSTIGLATAQIVGANFNAATGFSGRHGFTCTSCHNVPDAGPLGEQQIYDPPAKVTIGGLPDAWNIDGEYRLTITVTGGPPALPNPAPQGGFEIEANQGTFAAPSDMVDLINVYAAGAVTYTVAGTQVREWAVLWQAPELNLEPAPVQFWVAAMAANGNHIVATNISDQGEFGDSVDNISVEIPPSDAAMAAWREVRLAPPTIAPIGTVAPYQPIIVSGTHTDAKATAVGFRIDEGQWGSVEAVGSWKLQIDGLSPGEHELLIRSENAERQSSAVAVPIRVDAAEGSDTKATPLPFMHVVPALLVAGRRR